MTLLRSITLIFALLAQAWPVQAMMLREEAPKACAMGCCAAIAEMEMDACSCAEAPAPEKPLNVPPSSGRELVPQVVWMILQEAPLASRPPKSLSDGSSRFSFIERDLAAQPHVRLAVLHCSFLN